MKHICRLIFGFEYFSWLSAPELISLMFVLRTDVHFLLFRLEFWLFVSQLFYLILFLSKVDESMLPIFQF